MSDKYKAKLDAQTAGVQSKTDTSAASKTLLAQRFKSKEQLLQEQHKTKMSEGTSEDKKDKNKKAFKQKMGGNICCCGAVGCGIGPFVPTAGA